MITKLELSDGRMIANISKAHELKDSQKRRIVKLYLMLDGNLYNYQIRQAINHPQVIQQLLPQAKEHFLNN